MTYELCKTPKTTTTLPLSTFQAACSPIQTNQVQTRRTNGTPAHRPENLAHLFCWRQISRAAALCRSIRFLLRWLAAEYEEIDRICVKQSGGDPIVDSHLFFGKAERFGIAAADLLAVIGMRCGSKFCLRKLHGKRGSGSLKTDVRLFRLPLSRLQFPASERQPENGKRVSGCPLF